MDIAVFGLGYVGLTMAGCLVKQGHRVFGIEPNESKIAQIRLGNSPIQEPGLPELLALGVAERRLHVSHAVDQSLSSCDLAVVCVGTPSGADGAHNMSYIAEVSRQIAIHVAATRSRPLTVAYRSTVRPGTMETLIRPIFLNELQGRMDLVELVYNPEFLREAVAISDYFDPPKIVIGTADAEPSDVMDLLFASIEGRRFYTTYREAELTKFVDNSFHALKVCFANEIGRVCDRLGIDSRVVHEIFTSDTKLNISAAYLRPGTPFGGSCLPKDVRALVRISEEIGSAAEVIKAILPSNDAHKEFMYARIEEAVAAPGAILMLGLAFKANSDDLRESPHADLAARLVRAGHEVSIYDPHINPSHLVGANLSSAYARLPELRSMLVDQAGAETGDYSLVIDTNGTAERLELKTSNILDLRSTANWGRPDQRF